MEEKKEKKRKIYWLDFPAELPKVSLAEKQRIQEARWDVRKAFSGSICQAREGKGDRQTRRESG